MKKLLVAIMALGLILAPARADAPGVGREVGREEFKQSGALITSSAPIEVSTAQKLSDAMKVTNIEQCSVHMTIDTTAGVDSITVEVLGSPDGTNFKSFDPAVEITITADYDKIKALSLPVCTHIKFEFNTDTDDALYEVDKLVLLRY